jgi:hypothetical protein
MKAFSHLPTAIKSLGIVVNVINGKAWDKLLWGEIATPDHYHCSGGKTKG